MSENCKLLVLQDKCNIEIFLSPVYDNSYRSKFILRVGAIVVWWINHSEVLSLIPGSSSQLQGTKIFQYCTCPAGHVTYNFHPSCKPIHLSFKSICNKEHKGVLCNMTSSNSSQSTRPIGRVLWEESLVLSRFYS